MNTLQPLEEQLKNDLKSALQGQSDQKEDSIYCSCELPDFEQGEDTDEWYCINCGKLPDVDYPKDEDGEDTSYLI